MSHCSESCIQTSLPAYIMSHRVLDVATFRDITGRLKNSGIEANSMADVFTQDLTLKEIQEKSDKYVLGTVKRTPVAFIFGQGEFLYDTDNKQYIDFQSGVAVTCLGHSDADIVEAIRDQADRVMHTSNLVYNREQALLSEALIKHSFPGKVFLCNSGTEANEAAFKLARLHGQKKGGAIGMLALENSFHGRTFAAMSLTGQEKIHKGFGPIIPEIKYLPPNDVDQLERAIEENGHNICALFMELVQGESGVHPMTREFAQAARRLTQENDILLVLDEIQTGMGRTGKLWGYENYEIKPDVMTLAKGLGAGFPIGAMIVSNKFASLMSTGSHGSTFGGNHLGARVAYETLRIIMGREILTNVDGISDFMMRRLRVMQTQIPAIKEVRGIGLHIGVELDRPAAEVGEGCLANGLIVNITAGSTIRIVPPLNISLESAAKGLDILEAELKKLN